MHYIFRTSVGVSSPQGWIEYCKSVLGFDALRRKILAAEGLSYFVQFVQQSRWQHEKPCQPGLGRLALLLVSGRLELGELQLGGRQTLGKGTQAFAVAAVSLVARCCC